MKNFKPLPRIFYLLLAITAFQNFGNNYAAAFTEEELATQRLTDRINSLEKNLSTVQQELYRGGKSSKNKQTGTPDEPIGAEDEKNRAFNGRIEELDHQVSLLTGKLDKIITDIDFRITSLEKNIHDLQTEQAALNNKANENIDGVENSAKNDTSSDTDKPESTIKTDNTDSTDKANDTEETKAKDKTNKDNSIKKDSKDSSGKDSTNKDKDKKTSQGKSGASSQYEKAMEYMRLGKTADAEKSFKDFIANNKSSDLIGNAYYWLGETFYTRENYQQAAVNFLKGYQDQTSGNKAPDNLLKLGMSLKNLKKEKEACATFDKLKKEYPNADKDLMQKATAERKAAKCK